MNNNIKSTTFLFFIIVVLVMISYDQMYKEPNNDKVIFMLKEEYAGLPQYSAWEERIDSTFAKANNSTESIKSFVENNDELTSKEKTEYLIELEDREGEREKEFRNWLIKIIISAILLAFSFFIILSKKYGKKLTKLAVTTVQIIVGFWMGTIS